MIHKKAEDSVMQIVRCVHLHNGNKSWMQDAKFCLSPVSHYLNFVYDKHVYQCALHSWRIYAEYFLRSDVLMMTHC